MLKPMIVQTVNTHKMKIPIIICFLLLGSTIVEAQNNKTWFAFWDKDNYLRGFKDSNGVIKIEPRYMGLTTALKFNNIIEVMEESNASLSSYYLLKNGKKLGTDSLYI